MVRTFVLASAALAASLVTAPRAAIAAAATFKVDAVHSSVIFRVKHMNTSYAYGRFNDISGQFAFDDQDPTQSRFDFQVKTASVDSANAKRDQHLKGPDFFNAVQFPTIAFRSRSVTVASPGVYQVAGELMLHGVARPLTVMVTKTGVGRGPRGGVIAGFETVFDIKRTDFKMSQMAPAIGDDVRVIVSVEGGQ